MKAFFATACAVLLSACSGPPPITVGADPADPGARVPPLRYVPVTAGTIDYQPVAPRPWSASNESVAPRGRSE